MSNTKMIQAKNEVHRIFNETVNQILLKIEEKVNLSSFEVKEVVNRGIHQFNGLISEQLLNSKKTDGWHFDSDKKRLSGIKEAGNQGHINILHFAQVRFRSKINASRLINYSTLNQAGKRLQEDMNSVQYKTIKDPYFLSDMIQLKKYLDRNIEAVIKEYARFNESVNQAHAEFKESVNEVWKRENQVAFSERNKKQVEAIDVIKCPVCFDSVRVMEKDNRKLITTKCGHVFCDRCIQNQKCCPMCRQKVIYPFRFIYL